MVELNTRYFSHSCHSKVSNKPCLPRQYSRISLQRISLQLKNSVQNFATRAKLAISLKKKEVILDCDGNALINVLEKPCGPQTYLRQPTGCTSLLYILFLCDVDYMASKDIISMNDVFRARTEAAASTLTL